MFADLQHNFKTGTAWKGQREKNQKKTAAAGSSHRQQLTIVIEYTAINKLYVHARIDTAEREWCEYTRYQRGDRLTPEMESRKRSVSEQDDEREGETEKEATDHSLC